jgi:hypothetical protein
MAQISTSIDTLYDALMFAKSPQAAQKAGEQLVRTVLGDRAAELSLRDALRECCRVLRPSQDPKEESRFEEEFIELAFWPGRSRQLAA